MKQNNGGEKRDSAEENENSVLWRPANEGYSFSTTHDVVR